MVAILVVVVMRVVRRRRRRRRRKKKKKKKGGGKGEQAVLTWGKDCWEGGRKKEGERAQRLEEEGYAWLEDGGIAEVAAAS